MSMLARRPPNWAQALDFVGPTVRAAWWAWGLLALGVGAACLAVSQWDTVQAERSEAQQNLHRLQRAVHQQELAARAQTSQARAGHAGLSAEQLTHGSELTRNLAYPWLAVLDDADQRARQAHAWLLSLRVEPVTASAAADAPGSRAPGVQDVHASAAVASDDAALGWALGQGDGAELLSRAPLGAPVATANGLYAWRADAAWVGPTP